MGGRNARLQGRIFPEQQATVVEVWCLVQDVQGEVIIEVVFVFVVVCEFTVFVERLEQRVKMIAVRHIELAHIAATEAEVGEDIFSQGQHIVGSFKAI